LQRSKINLQNKKYEKKHKEYIITSVQYNNNSKYFIVNNNIWRISCSANQIICWIGKLREQKSGLDHSKPASCFQNTVFVHKYFGNGATETAFFITKLRFSMQWRLTLLIYIYIYTHIYIHARTRTHTHFALIYIYIYQCQIKRLIYIYIYI